MAEVEIENYTESGYIRDKDGNLIPDYDMTIKVFDDGDVISGTIVQIDRDEVLVDVGYKSEGVIPLNELSIRKGVNPENIIEIGDEIDALVLQKEDKDGRLILSKKRAEFEKSWDVVENHSREKNPIGGTVIEVVKGGLILDIGLRGFLPASLVDVRRVRDLNQYIGEKLDCLIIEIDRNRNNVVLSRRAVIDDERKHERKKILDNIKKGDTVKGTVSSIVDFGDFIDLGGLDGLVHISELSWSHVDHPSEVLELSQEVEVKVLDIDTERGRVSLGYKHTQENPWQEMIADFNVGDELPGKVIKVVPFGVFIELLDGVEALIHNSEFENSECNAKVGDEMTSKIAEIDVDRRRISMTLGLKIDSEDEALEDKADKVESKTEEVSEKIVDDNPAAETVDETTSTAKAVEDAEVAVEEALDDSKIKKDAGKRLLKKKKEDDEEASDKEPDPGSLEDVLKQMKQATKPEDE